MLSTLSDDNDEGDMSEALDHWLEKSKSRFGLELGGDELPIEFFLLAEDIGTHGHWEDESEDEQRIGQDLVDQTI